MTFNLARHKFALSLALRLYDNILMNDRWYPRPNFVKRWVAAKLRAGLRALEAYLKRILIVMALELEHELKPSPKYRPENLARPKANKPPRPWKPFPTIYPYYERPYPKPVIYRDVRAIFEALPKKSEDPIDRPPFVSIDKLFARLDYLRDIAREPMAKARRLSYNLARNRHGILMAPPEPKRGLRKWGREISVYQDGLAYDIITLSKARPPPLPPRRRLAKINITNMSWGADWACLSIGGETQRPNYIDWSAAVHCRILADTPVFGIDNAALVCRGPSGEVG